MFIDIDYSKKLTELKLHLAKPNKQIISHIYEKFGENIDLKLGNTHELNFSIPYYIEDSETLEMIKNKHVDLIKEKMLIRATLGTEKEWFIIEEIEESGEDENSFTVTAYSLNYELRNKRIGEMKEESVNATTLLTNILQGTVWSIDTVDVIFNAMYRSFEASNTNALDAIFKAGETYGALIKWDTVNRKVSFVEMKNHGKFRGLTINYGRFLKSIKRNRTTDELVTRLYIYGNEDLTVHGVNPTGQGYIENFDFFMYPFERDVNKVTLKSSHFMSDALCHAILDHQAKIETETPLINDLYNQKATKQSQLRTEEDKMAQLKLDLESILALLDIAQASGDQTLINQRKAERDAKQTEISNQQVIIDGIKADITNLDSQIQTKQNSISHDTNFTTQLLDELSLFVIEKEWRDDRYINAQELYDDGLKRFDEIRQPKVVINVSIDNLLNIVEEQYYWDKLILGDLVKVKYPQMNIEYMAKIVEIKYNLQRSEVELIIASTSDLISENEKLLQLLYGSSNATSLINNNKYKWDKVSGVREELDAVTKNEWDANKNKITAGVNNQIEFGNRGLIVRNPDFSNEMVIIQSGIIALSEDNGETWKTAIKPKGIISERLIGKILIGQNLLIENSSGLYTINHEGFTIQNGSLNIVGGGVVDNGITLNSTEGLTITRSDGLLRTKLNATTSDTDAIAGFKIQKNIGTVATPSWQNVLYADANGNLVAETLTANKLIIKNGADVLIDADTKTIDFSKFSTVLGKITATNIEIKGTSVSDGVKTTFSVDANGNVSISGNINMISGSINWGTGIGQVTPINYSDVGGSKPPASADNTISVLSLTKADGTSKGIKYNYSTDEYELDLDKVTTGVLTGRTVQTAISGSRVQIDSANGFAQYDSFGRKRIQVDVSSAGGEIGFYLGTERRGVIRETGADFSIFPDVNAQMYLGISGKTTYPRGTWNFSQATLTNFTVPSHNHGNIYVKTRNGSNVELEWNGSTGFWVYVNGVYEGSIIV